MPIFKIENEKFKKIKNKDFDYERDMQALVEKNLEEIFGLEFVSGALNKEFSVKNQHQTLYMDTFAYDPQTNSFVIIEYKKGSSYSVIDQGYAYLSGLLNNKADFVLEYNERKEGNVKKDDIDWSQSRVIFISREFTPYQKGAIEFRDLPFELWEIELLEGDIVSLNPIKAAQTQESITKLAKGVKTIDEVSKEIKTFTYEDHAKRAPEKTLALLESLREKIFAMDPNIKEKPVQSYLGYKFDWYNFAAIHVYHDKLQVDVRTKNIANDPEKRFKVIPSTNKPNLRPVWRMMVNDKKDIDYAMKVIQGSFDNAPDR